MPAALDAATLESFKTNPWPGNVRQLRNAVARAALVGEHVTMIEDCTTLSAASPQVADSLLPLREAKDEFERNYLVQLLARHKGNLASASRAAGLHPKSLARLLRRYGLGRS